MGEKYELEVDATPTVLRIWPKSGVEQAYLRDTLGLQPEREEGRGEWTGWYVLGGPLSTWWWMMFVLVGVSVLVFAFFIGGSFAEASLQNELHTEGCQCALYSEED